MAKGVWFNKSTIIELAKTSFRGFKTTALAERNEEKQRQFKQNQRNTKRRDRRKLVRTLLYPGVTAMTDELGDRNLDSCSLPWINMWRCMEEIRLTFFVKK